MSLLGAEFGQAKSANIAIGSTSETVESAKEVKDHDVMQHAKFFQST